MAQTEIKYTRLPGRASGRGGFITLAAARGVCTIWMASDHLLLVERYGYTENYRRFYFTDIQAVIIRRTQSHNIISAILGALTLIFFLFALNVNDQGGRIALWIIGGFFALFFLINLAMGPTCVTQIKTVVQNEAIPSWSRLRATRKALAILRPLLQQAQGAMDPQDLKERWRAGLAGQSTAGAI